MEINSMKNISEIIYLLEKNITELLLQKKVDVEKIESLSNVRFQYIEELNSLIRVKNTRDMFNKKKK